MGVRFPPGPLTLTKGKMMFGFIINWLLCTAFSAWFIRYSAKLMNKYGYNINTVSWKVAICIALVTSLLVILL